ncbi:MAG: glucose-1-phosphate thymidylyltransferase [Crocinitomicaceae bacterium]|nr:glucose-1-phosphate thymidylyltransferase [Flavobacteriales bacterium]NQZ34351.1 glucose-1-phosphate thymidylyltransferase [Crocinitomicaceae bacterium]
MNLTLDDNDNWLKFAPLTLTRPIGNLRMGIFTNDERWKIMLRKVQVGYKTEDFLSRKFPDTGGVHVNACVILNREIADAIILLGDNEELFFEKDWIARRGDASIKVKYKNDVIFLSERWDMFQLNGEVLKMDFEFITDTRSSQQLSDSNTVIGDPSLIFLEEGAKVEASILNTTEGPIYIGRNAEIMEGSMVRGPLAMNESSALKLGTKIYGPTTLGPHCKVGGEVNNCIFQGYSNKGHDGFLGNSLIGEWCNIGADTNSSNLKNNYGTVKTFSFESMKEEQTDVQFMGLTMGDHSKCGINTMFNTAAVVGVSCNVYGAEFPPKYIHSFQWGPNGDTYDFDRALESANNMMVRRGLMLSGEDVDILQHISDTSNGFSGNK